MTVDWTFDLGRSNGESIVTERIAIVGLDWSGGSDEGLDAFAQLMCMGLARTEPIAARPAAEVAGRLLSQAIGEQSGIRIGVLICGARDGADVARGLRTRFSKRRGAVPVRGADAWAVGYESPNPLPALATGQDWLGKGLVDLVVIASEAPGGSGAVLLARDASVVPGRAYALVESVTTGHAQDGRRCCRQGLRGANMAAGQIGYLDTGVWPPPGEVIDSYWADGMSCAVGAVAPVVGAPSPMGALINAVLCLHLRRWVPSPAIPITDQGVSLGETPFHVVGDARPWFRGAGEDARRAALYHRDAMGTGHVVLAEANPHGGVPPLIRQIAGPTRTLIPVWGETRDQLMAGLDAVRRRLQGGEPLQSVARQAHAGTVRRDADRRSAVKRRDGYVISVVGQTREEALQEIQKAVDGVGPAFERGRDWSTPGGSAFTPAPLGGAGVAFVYPGAFNSYVGMGRDLLQHFPSLHERLGTLVSDLGRAVSEHKLYPRSREAPSEGDLIQHSRELTLDPPALIESGTIFAVAHTVIMRDLFGIQPEMALGYSLGETSMLWASGVWVDGDASSAALRSSPLFKTRICGPKAAVKEFWGLGPGEKVSWSSYLLKARVDDVQRAIAGEPRVYLTLVNQSDEVIIAGDAEGCSRVIETLGCHALPIPYEVVIHTAAVASEYWTFRRLYTLPVVNRPPVRFYSAAEYGPLVIDTDSLADAMARMTCAPVDFPRLVERAYADGARVFVELGPLATCTRRIKHILRGRAHLAVAANPSPGGDLNGIVGALAHLLTHRVPLDLSPLYDDGDPMLGRLDLSGRVDQSPNTDVTVDASPSRRQTTDGRHEPAPSSQTIQARPHSVVLDEEALREFAGGDVERCFGPDFAVYRGRRLPRIPNGDLMMLSRIVSVDASPGVLTGTPSLVSEYDVPEDGWYYTAIGARGLPPLAILMELGMQPCGVLSAYLRSSLLDPQTDLYFRNLDGHARVLAEPDLRGRTVRNEVVLRSSVRGPGAVLQSYAFSLDCQGVRFYEGEATFGYFRRDQLNRQTSSGVAGSLPQKPGRIADRRRMRIPATPGAAARRLNLVRELLVSPDAEQGHATLWGSGVVSPADWYFAAHFFQDPVMPGSLGVEAALQALVAYGRWRWPHLAAQPVHQRIDRTMSWHYRGQITPEDSGFHVQVDVSSIEEAPSGVLLAGDASIWRGGAGSREPDYHALPIYKVSGVAVQLGCVQDCELPDTSDIPS